MSSFLVQDQVILFLRPILPQHYERQKLTRKWSFKATKVDGVYDCDPFENPNARLYQTLTYGHVLANDLRVMDGTAIALCKENNIPIVVFNLSINGNILRAIKGETVGTTVGGLCEVS